MSDPEELDWLEKYLREAEKSDRLKAFDLFDCCRWALPIDDIIEQASSNSPTEELREEVQRISDEDVYLVDVSEEAQALIADAIDVHDNELYARLSDADPAEIPSWFYMSPMERGEGWLVHFSDHASSIVGDGFTHGAPDIQRLGLTTYGTRHGQEGYNFAFRTEDVRRYAYTRHGPKYGKNAVIFWAPYLLVRHHTDEEPQAIFWGPSASNIHQLYGEPGSWWLTDEDGEEREFEILEDVEEYLDDIAVFAKKLKRKLLR